MGSALPAAHLLCGVREGGQGAAPKPVLTPHPVPCRAGWLNAPVPGLWYIFKGIAGGGPGEAMGVKWKKAVAWLEEGYFLGAMLLQAT